MAAPSPMPPAAPPTLIIAAWGCIAGGAFVAALFGYKLLLAAKPVAAPLGIVMLVAGAVDIVVGIGLLRRNRAAWSFALALHIVGSIVCLLAVPAMAKAGLPRPVAMLPVLGTVGMLILIAVSAPDELVPPTGRRRG